MCRTPILRVAIFLLCINLSKEELFTSTEEFRVVLEAQKEIASELKRYIAAEEERLEKIKK